MRSLKNFSELKLSTFYMLQNMNFNITYLPKPYQKNFTFWFIRNWFCNLKLFVSKCPNFGRGRGGLSQVWASIGFQCQHWSKYHVFLNYAPNLFKEYLELKFKLIKMSSLQRYLQNDIDLKLLIINVFSQTFKVQAIYQNAIDSFNS